MSVWRKKALELFPDLRSELQNRSYTIYQLFFHASSLGHAFAAQGDYKKLEQIYRFAQWCLSQHRAKNLWNAAAVAFFEHIFDDKLISQEKVSLLTQEIIDACYSLFAVHLADAQLTEFNKKIIAAGMHVPKTSYLNPVEKQM